MEGAGRSAASGVPQEGVVRQSIRKQRLAFGEAENLRLDAGNQFEVTVDDKKYLIVKQSDILATL